VLTWWSPRLPFKFSASGTFFFLSISSKGKISYPYYWIQSLSDEKLTVLYMERYPFLGCNQSWRRWSGLTWRGGVLSLGKLLQHLSYFKSPYGPDVSMHLLVVPRCTRVAILHISPLIYQCLATLKFAPLQLACAFVNFMAVCT
jgi:hypothetical protein